MIPDQALYALQASAHRDGGRPVDFRARGTPQREVRHAIRQIGDDEPAGPWLEKYFDGRVVVKSDYAALGARAFHKLFREQGSEKLRFAVPGDQRSRES